MNPNLSTSNSKIRLARDIALVLLLVAVADFVLGTIWEQLYFRQQSGINYKTLYSMQQCREDIIILGTSIASENIDPRPIEQYNRLSAYNAARHAQSIYYYLGVQEAILKRYTPRLLVIDLDPTDLYDFPPHADRLSVLLPFYRTHPEIRYVLNEYKSRYEPIKMLSRLYPYNSEFFSILKNLGPERDNIKGFYPMDGRIEPETLENFRNNMASFLQRFEKLPLSPAKEETFRKLIANAHRHNVPVMVTASPLLFDFGKNRGLQKLTELCAELNVPLFDYTAHPDFRDPGLFYDMSHLNKWGAEMFSEYLAKDIATLLKEQN